jgi:hypothetical protein
MMKTEIITHGDVSIIVSEATALIGMKRSRMKVEASGTIDNDTDISILRIITYPDLLAATVEIKGMNKPTFEEFLDLPDTLVMKWEQAVYRLNPHWLPGSQEQQEKKAEI